MTIEFDFIGGDKIAKFTNDLLRAGDMFDSRKMYVNHERLTISVDEQPDLSQFNNNVVKSFEAIGGYVVFVGIRKIDSRRVNDGYIYFRKDINTLSMFQGSKLGWCLFKDVLERLDYTVETDEHMLITKVI